MIIQLRVDDRLIHGQVALIWTKELNTNNIVVANDDASTNKMLQMTLQMAVPTGKKLLVKNVKDAINVFNDPRAKAMRIFALTNTIQDALKIVESCPDMESVNVANVGRFDESDKAEKVKVSDWIIVNPKELHALEALSKKTLPVYHQVIPSNPKIPATKLLNDLKK